MISLEFGGVSGALIGGIGGFGSAGRASGLPLLKPLLISLEFGGVSGALIGGFGSAGGALLELLQALLNPFACKV